MTATTKMTNTSMSMMPTPTVPPCHRPISRVWIGGLRSSTESCIQTCRSSGGKPVYRNGLVYFSRSQHRGRELRSVGRVWKVLGFETEGATAFVGRTLFPAKAAIQKVGRVELETGLTGQHVEDPTGDRVEDRRRVGQTRARPVDDEVVIVAVAEAKLLVVVLDPLADGNSLRGNPMVFRRPCESHR